MIFILLFILILNIVAIVLTYYCLSNVEKKERIIFVAVGIAIMYIITLFVYWISTKNIEIKEVSDIGKNIITFMFVPINSILTLPLIAKSYNKYKIGHLAGDKLRNRIIVLAIPFIIILIIECLYFADIQKDVIELIEKNQNESNQIEQNVVENIDDANLTANEIINEVVDNEIVNNEENMMQEN